MAEQRYAFLGTIVFASKTVKWVTQLSYVGLGTLACVSGIVLPQIADKEEERDIALLACGEQVDQMQALTLWVFFTNVIGLLSAFSCTQFEKGNTVSVIGSIVFILNFVQSIFLFFFAQARVFNSDIRDCVDVMNDVEKEKTYQMQHITGLCHVAAQYLKLVIIIVSFIYLRCCLRGKSNSLH